VSNDQFMILVGNQVFILAQQEIITRIFAKIFEPEAASLAAQMEVLARNLQNQQAVLVKTFPELKDVVGDVQPVTVT